MFIRVTAIAKGSKYNPADPSKGKTTPTTKLTMFDLVQGDDIDLKFPGELSVKVGTMIDIEGEFKVSHFQSGTYLTAIDGQYVLNQVGGVVRNDQKVKQPAEVGK